MIYNEWFRDISIHALREEGDVTSPDSRLQIPISIHALREEGDVAVCIQRGNAARFLSTPSARRATQTRRAVLHVVMHFYPRPPRGGRLLLFAIVVFPSEFLSTPSARRATHLGHI